MTEEKQCLTLDLFLFKYNLTDSMFNALKLTFRSGKKVSGKVKILNGEIRLFPDNLIENMINRSECELSGKLVETFSDGDKIRLVVTYPSGKKIVGKELYEAEDPALEEKIYELYKVINNGR